MHEYQVGGSLAVDDPTYIHRSADDALYQALLDGEFCYVLTSRQMGKSSLRLRTRHRLESSGQGCCATVDMTRIGSQQLNPEQWYLGLAFDLLRKFSLQERVHLQSWWQQLGALPPVQKLSQFIEEVLLTTDPNKPLFIFLDEIDSIRRLSFPVDDFFGLVRFCYNERAENPVYRRLTWALFGVATPRDLVTDVRQTPFNIGRAIHLSGFSLTEAAPLAAGLMDLPHGPEPLLAEVVQWTGGQPFLTQKLCSLLRENGLRTGYSGATAAATVAEVVRSQVIDNWERQDDPEHLRTIRDRILTNEQESGRLLSLYQVLLNEGPQQADGSKEQGELKLSGIAIEHQGRLQVANPIYRAVFDRDWVSQCLSRQRPYAAALNAWITSSCHDSSRLLIGDALQEAIRWSTDKRLGDIDYRFLSASQEWDAKMVRLELEAQEKANQLLATAQKKAHQIIWLGYLSLGTCLTISAIALVISLMK